MITPPLQLNIHTLHAIELHRTSPGSLLSLGISQCKPLSSSDEQQKCSVDQAIGGRVHDEFALRPQYAPDLLMSVLQHQPGMDGWKVHAIDNHITASKNITNIMSHHSGPNKLGYCLCHVHYSTFQIHNHHKTREILHNET